MNKIKIIAFSHQSLDICQLGKTQVAHELLQERFSALLKINGISEVMYLATCNRTEFILNCSLQINKEFLSKFFRALHQNWNENHLQWAIDNAAVYVGENAVRHLFEVASSMNSLVVGEREIITQVRNAYDHCKKINLSGDTIRLLVEKTIECAKRVYTETNIAKNPVSVVSLAYRKLKSFNIKTDARIVMVGAGTTNTNMAKYLKKHGFTNFTVFNRTLGNGEKLAVECGGKAFPLSELKNYKGGFDVIVTCTAYSGNIITKDIYKSLVGEDKDRKVVIDLAVPNDLDAEILKNYEVNLIAVNNLQEIAKKNLEEREKELVKCKKIVEENLEEFRAEFKERMVELAMSWVPGKVSEICHRAKNEVFANDISQLDEQSKATLDKVISYIQKKYISVPMRMAKEVLLKKSDSYALQ